MRNTEGTMMRNRLVMTLVVLAAVGIGAGFALAGDPPRDAPGIWIYNTKFSTSMINLTNYTIKQIGYNVKENGSCTSGKKGSTNPYQFVDNIPAYRTQMDALGDACNMVPLNYDGCATYQVGQFPEFAFDICFNSQQAHGLLEKGFWVYLKAHGTGPWASANTLAYNRWATPINESEHNMHNIMTLISSKMMVTLYSMNNHSLVVLVQQYWENKAGWDDSKVYNAKKLDFVDNDGKHVPH
jgi:hypothetical protein